MRVATYTRISTDEEHQPYSLEAQAERLGKYIASQDGWELARTFTDERSGATLDRPALQRALQEAKAGRFDLLLVYRVDRLARSVRGLAHILEELDAAHVTFRSATEPFDTASPAGRMMVQMLGVFAEFERATIIDRVVAGMERKAARGEWMGGTIPFGYRRDALSKAIEVQESEAATVRLIFDAYVNRDLGSGALAEWLNARGYRTRPGRPWCRQGLLKVLRNRSYVGEIYFRGSHHPASHPALIERGVFDKAQAILKVRGEDIGKRRANASPYLLSGLVVCGRCGHRYVGNSARGRWGGKFHYYHCLSRQKRKKTECDAVALPARKLEEAILGSLAEFFTRPKILERAIGAARASTSDVRPGCTEELARIDAEIRKAEQSIERYFDAFEDGSMQADQCGARVRSLGEKLASLRLRRQELQSALDEAPVDPFSNIDVDAVRNVVATLFDVAADIPGRTALLRKLIHERRVDSPAMIHSQLILPSVPGTPQERGLDSDNSGTPTLSESKPRAIVAGPTITLG